MTKVSPTGEEGVQSNTDPKRKGKEDIMGDSNGVNSEVVEQLGHGCSLSKKPGEIPRVKEPRSQIKGKKKHIRKVRAVTRGTSEMYLSILVLMPY